MAPLFPRALAASVALVLLGLAAPARADDPVQIESDGPVVEVHDKTNLETMAPIRFGRGWRMGRAPVYAPVCDQTPCTTQLPGGTHALALSLPGGPIVPGEELVPVYGPSRVTASYDRHTGARVAGAALLAAGIVGGIALEVVAASHTETDCAPGSSTFCNTTRSFDPVTGGLGAAALVGGAIGGIALLMVPDSAHFSVTPMSVGAPIGAREGSGAGARANGLAVTVRF